MVYFDYFYRIRIVEAAISRSVKDHANTPEPLKSDAPRTSSGKCSLLR
jgi:hypothetical protein